MPKVRRFTAFTYLWNCAQRLISSQHKNFIGIHQVRIDLHRFDQLRLGIDVFVVVQRGRAWLFMTKPNDHAMHRRHATRLVAPLEGSMRKLDVHAQPIQLAPEHAHLFALGDGVGRDKRAANARPFPRRGKVARSAG